MLTGYAPRLMRAHFRRAGPPPNEKKRSCTARMVQNLDLTKSGLGQLETSGSLWHNVCCLSVSGDAFETLLGEKNYSPGNKSQKWSTT